VIDAMARAMGADYATVHRGVYARSAEMTLAFEAARRRVASSSAGRKRRSSSRAARPRRSTLLRRLGRGESEGGRPHPALHAGASFQHRAVAMLRERIGVAIDVCPLTEEGRIDLDAAEAMLTPAHRLVALAHVSNVLGSVLDVRRAADMAHAVGAKLLVDGCQAAPRLAVDVAALDCDFYVFSAHKLYGPTGIGALWARAEILDAMPPWQGGGSMIDRVTFDKTTYAPAPQRFEAGTPAIAEAIALHAAIDYVEAIGLDAIHAHETALVRQLRASCPHQLGAPVRPGGLRRDRQLRA
jgi:cysteine desulfurase/selenocysteine lyase